MAWYLTISILTFVVSKKIVVYIIYLNIYMHRWSHWIYRYVYTYKQLINSVYIYTNQFVWIFVFYNVLSNSVSIWKTSNNNQWCREEMKLQRCQQCYQHLNSTTWHPPTTKELMSSPVIQKRCVPFSEKKFSTKNSNTHI